MYILPPLNEIPAALGGEKSVAKNSNSGDNEKSEKPKDNNCEIGLPPRKWQWRQRQSITDA
jgi:hypothetical protein